MDQMLYIKYNSLRKPAYRLTTEIHQENGHRYVVKRPENSAAAVQIDRMIRNHELLEQMYNGISILPVRRDGDRLVFPFITGKTLKDRIVDGAKDREEIIARIKEQLDVVLSVREKCCVDFVPTEDFIRQFGEEYPTEGKAFCPANIDSLFDNFVQTEDELYCIDYEWVFEYPVPADFIKYRILKYFYDDLDHSVFEGTDREEFISRFGLDEEDQEIFSHMEYCFQQSVHGENVKYLYLSRYRKRDIPMSDPIGTYDLQQKKIQDRDTRIASLNHEYQITVAKQRNDILNLEGRLQAAESLRDAYHRQYEEISNAFFWKITKPMRTAVIKIKTLAQGNERVYSFLRFVKSVIRNGPRDFKANWTRYRKENRNPTLQYWPEDEEYLRQQEAVFDREIRFSILVPLYNTPKAFLTVMIDSVARQSYGNWELCLADGSDAKHAYVGKTCRRLARKDQRIKYRKLAENRGISENTNACLEMATGDYIALFDHDDLLHPSALYEAARTICETSADFLYTDENTFHEIPSDAFNPHYKPDFAPDTLRANNYICHLTVFDRQLLQKAGKFRPEFDGSQDFDLVLRLTEQAKKIVHIPKVLYYWRAHKNSVAETVDAKPYVVEAAKNAIREHLERVGLKGDVLESKVTSMYRLKYEIEGEPLISIIIPNYDHADDLKRCIDSILEKTTYKRFEIVIVENNSTEQSTFDYYRELKKDPRIRVVKWKGIFNFSGICNYGVKHSNGEHILLLNNDVEVITPDWLQEMLMYSQRKDVGTVGAKLYYPDNTIQHAGIGIGLLTLAGHYHRHFDGKHPGYMGRLSYAQDVSAVTGACMMIRRDVYDEMNGYDESFEVAFNDVDFCMRVRQAGYLIVFTPFAELYHYESKSRGLDDNPEKQARFLGEVTRFQTRWEKELAAGDPYYNPNFSLEKEDFSVIGS